ncbi:MAG: CBS domain-containing protein [Candidatus Hydrothermarchaeales archaeon]
MGSELRVKEVMKRKPLTVAENDLATKARSLFRRHGYRSLPVLSKNGELMGILTNRDILNITSARSNILVRGLMSAPLLVTTEDEEIRILAEKFVSVDVSVSLVVEKDNGRKLAGLVSVHDIIKGYLDSGVEPPKRLVGDITAGKVTVCSPNDGISKIWKMMEQTGFTGIPVVKGKRIVGMITRGNILKSGFARLEREDEKGSSKKSPLVEKVMQTPATTVTPDTDVREAARIIISQRIGRLPVVKKIGTGQVELVGIVDRTDILKAFM